MNIRVIVVACVIIGVIIASLGQTVAQTTRVAFYNVENFFDTKNDSLKNDDAFTPRGTNHWTQQRYEHKRNCIFKVIASMAYPALLGLAEVENAEVVEELCKATPLRKKKYEWIHFDSPDSRGADCALLYRRDCVRLIAAESIPVSTEDYKTRDVLMFGGVTTSGDTLYTLVCHLPSKLGGELARSHRGRIAKVMRNVADTIATNHPNAVVVVMGDFNEDMYEDDYRESFGFVDGFVNKEGFEDLMYSVRQEIGTHNFGGRWSCLDHILVKLPKDESWETPNAIIFDAPFLLQSDDRHLDVKPFRTYVAMNYKGGYSDHLPIYVDLKKSVR